MNFRQLGAFVAVYEEGSFSRAAARLNATQSGLSMQIRNLEGALGLAVFERTAKGVIPTYAGERLYQRAVDILRQISATGAKMQTIAHGISGHLRLGLMPTFTRGALAPALSGFVADFPNVQVSVVEAYSAVLTEQVAAAEIDFAIVPKAAPRQGLRTRYLGTDRELLVCRAGGPLTHLAPVRLADLPPLRLVLPGRGNARRDALEAYAEMHGVRIVALIDMDAMIATLEFVANSEWVTILPTTICVNDLDGSVRSLHPLVRPSLTVDYAVIEPAKRALSAPASLFLDRLRLHLREIDARWAGILRRRAPARSGRAASHRIG
ncbi:MAG: LysR family transcriptional regulator [Geminicoccaceae bacterium]